MEYIDDIGMNNVMRRTVSNMQCDLRMLFVEKGGREAGPLHGCGAERRTIYRWPEVS